MHISEAQMKSNQKAKLYQELKTLLTTAMPPRDVNYVAAEIAFALARMNACFIERECDFKDFLTCLECSSRLRSDLMRDLLPLWRTISRLQGKYGVEECETAIRECARQADTDTVDAPPSLISLVIKLLSHESGGVMADIGCGHGLILAQALEEDSCLYGEGIDINQRNVNFSEMVISSLKPRCEIYCNSVFDFIVDHMRKYDKVFCFPPFGMRMDHYWKDIQSMLPGAFPNISTDCRSELIFALTTVAAMKESGRAVVVLPEGVLSCQKGGSVIAREYLLNNGYLDSVIMLPERLLEQTQIGISLLVFSKKANRSQVTMIDASDLGKKGRRSNVLLAEDVKKIINAVYDFRADNTWTSDHCEIISCDEIRESGCNFSCHHYFKQKSMTMKETIPKSGYELAAKILETHPDDAIETMLRYSGGAECDWLEFKAGMTLLPEDEARGFRPDDLYWDYVHSIVAMANTRGGAFVIGVDDKTHMAIPLSSCDPRHVLELEGKEGYLRKEVINRIDRRDRRWTTRDGTIRSLKESIVPYLEGRYVTFKGTDVIVLLVKPVDIGEELFVSQMIRNGDVFESLPYRSLSGIVKRNTQQADILSYLQNRKIGFLSFGTICAELDVMTHTGKKYDGEMRDATQQNEEQLKEYRDFVESGILGFDFERYRDSITYYCMPHDKESEGQYRRHYKPPFPFTDVFKSRIRLILQTKAPVLYLEHPEIYELRSKGYDLIQTIKFRFEYWKDNAIDENISSKAKYVVDTLENLGYEMGVAGNFPSVTDYVIDVLEYAEKQVKDHKMQEHRAAVTCSASEEIGSSSSTSTGGAISGFSLVEAILDHFGNEGVAKLLECTDHQETEYLEFKTDYRLSEDEKRKKVGQDALDWDIALAIIAIANTAGGALVIGIGEDNHTVFPVEVEGEKEAFLRKIIYHPLLPDQRVWKDGKGGKWVASELPRVEVRLYPCSDGIHSGNVVVMLIEPMPKGRCITLEERVNCERRLLVQRKLGLGEVSKCYDTARFRTLDNERRIQRSRYLALLRRLIPDANASPVGKSSGVYRFKPVYGGKDIENPLVRQMDGHRLCCEFKPGDQIDKYTVKERIGSGGMGVVYRVRHVTLGREYALKAFKMESEDASMAKERFRAEAQVLMQLNHPGLPKVHDLDFAETAECYYLVQDLIVGKDGKPHEVGGFVVNPNAAAAQGLVCISSEMALKWLRQVCEIANYLHGKGIAHRDITLKNLLVTDDGDVKLTDFGVAKVMDPELRRTIDCQVTMTFTQTPNGSAGFLGTLRYLPPEVKEKRKADINPEATDVWAIGVSFFKLLTGEWFEYQQFSDYEWNDGVWGALLRGMLKVDSKKRLSCAEVLRVLDDKGSGSFDWKAAEYLT